MSNFLTDVEDTSYIVTWEGAPIPSKMREAILLWEKFASDKNIQAVDATIQSLPNDYDPLANVHRYIVEYKVV